MHRYWSGQTPAHVACFLGHAKSLAILAAMGADLSRVDIYGQTPAHYACSRSHVMCLRILIAAGAYLDVQSTYSGSSGDLKSSNHGRFIEGCTLIYLLKCMP
jgi:ankyrin repeat protein